MSNLRDYNKKRNFKKTKEPIGKKETQLKNIFCVQHHYSRKEHYDFRLEYNGVLISFAILSPISAKVVGLQFQKVHHIIQKRKD